MSKCVFCEGKGFILAHIHDFRIEFTCKCELGTKYLLSKKEKDVKKNIGEGNE